MAQLKDILETERLRADMAQCLRINLFKEGTFYRAYEWSAWLCVRYVQEFKTTRRLMKNTDELRLTDIMHDILSYPIESRTPMESMSFLSELKTRLSKII